MAFTFSVQSASARRVTAILVLNEMYFVELQGSHRHKASRAKPFSLPQKPPKPGQNHHQIDLTVFVPQAGGRRRGRLQVMGS